MKTVVAMFVSATLAAPAPLWAHGLPSRNGANGEATEGIPVILQQFKTKNGEPGYIAITPYAAEDEQEVITYLANKVPKNMALGVTGPHDPALKFALQTGNLPLISSYIVADVDQAEAVKAAPQPLRERLKNKIKAITEVCKNKTAGLITSVVVSTIVASYVGVSSASVPVGVGAAIALFSWNAYQAVASHKWESYLEWGGEKVSRLIRKIAIRGLGRPATQDEKAAAEAAGMFGATFLANTSIQGGILAASGAFTGFILKSGWIWGSVDVLLTSFWYGFLSSTDILDGMMSKKIKEGKLPKAWNGIDVFGAFVVIRMIAAACFEVAGYLNIPGVQVLLAGTATTTLLYMALRPVSQTIDAGVDKSKKAVQVTYRYYRRAAYRAQMSTGGCEGTLTRSISKDVVIARGSLKGEPAE